MPIHQTLIIASFILLLIAAVFELPLGAPWAGSWAHFLGWLGLALFVLASVVT